MSVRARVRASVLVCLVALLGAGLLSLGTAGTAASLPAARTSLTTAPNCGPAIYRKADGSRYRCTFADYFGGTTLNTAKWSVVTSQTANWGKRTDCFVNSRYNLAVNNGVLKLVSRRGLPPFSCGPPKRAYTATATSATVSTIGKYTQHFGRIEIRAKFPYTRQLGLQSALWMWPADTAWAAWGLSGEMDIAEWYSRYADRVIPYLHYPMSFLDKSKATNVNCLVPNVANWHTYVIVWSKSQITISYDGKTCLRNTNPGSEFDQSYFLSLTQALGVGKNAPTASTPMRATTEIDYVRIWS